MLWRLFAALIGKLPYRALRPLGKVAAFLAFDLLRIRRKHVVHAMERAGVGGVDLARESYRSLGAGALELLWLAGRPRAPLAEVVRIAGWERFERAHARGRGVVVATAHTGNWDLAACACAARTELAVVTKRLRARGLDAFWQGTRKARGLDLIAPGSEGILPAVRARLARGSSIALLVDQDPRRSHGVVDAPFLGAPAVHDSFPATVAARSGAPLVVAFARRLDDGTHVVDVVDVHVPPERAGSAWIAATTRAIAEALDAYVRADPKCWLWLHRRWKTQPRARGDVPRVEPHELRA